jgi:hypothetical protein
MSMTLHAKPMLPFVYAALVLAMSAPGTASAQPPGFPDLSGLADVTDQYLGPAVRNPGPVSLFSTRTGLNCSISNADNGLAHCTGALPGIAGIPAAPGTGACNLGLAQVFAGSPATISHYKGNCPSTPPVSRVLSPGEKVFAGGTTCGVTALGVLACVNSENNSTHGFVLQPSGSSAF